MGLLDLFKKSDNGSVSSNSAYEIDDMSYIAEIKHSMCGAWHQYDVSLAARGYGWGAMLDWADYMVSADLDHISKASKSMIVGAPEENILDEYIKIGSFKEMPLLQEEAGILSVGGMSKTVGGPVQIVWINQTRFLRFFTITDNEDLMRRYVETVIRRTINTPDAMKLARPVEKADR